ncbi:hypothetical protein ACOMHN_031662 [Nucella lapillus]
MKRSVQAVEECFLQLEVKERSRALNILQSSINKLLNFVGDADIVSANLSASVPDSFLANLENSSKETQSSYSQDSVIATKQAKKSAAPRKRRNGNRAKKTKCQKNDALFSNASGIESNARDCSFSAEAASSQNANVHAAGSSLQRSATGKCKQENKDNFEDDFQELADFDYDFNPSLQSTSTSSVSRAGNSHMTQCNGKLTGKMLSISAASDGSTCPVSGAPSAYPEQVSHEGGNTHYATHLLANAAAEMKTNCHLSQAAQYGTQIIACSQIEAGGETSQFAAGVVDSNGNPSQYAGGVIDTSGDPSQYAGGVIDSNGDPSQYAGSVMDSSGNPSQYAGGVIDSSGDPSQYASTVIDSSGETSQYAGNVIDSTGEGSQYATGGIDMSDGQEAGLCNASHVHAQFTGAMIPTAQDVTVCTTTQYPGTVLAMSMPESISYSAAHYSHTIMQGLNCGSTHPQFSNAVLDMSTASGRQNDSAIAATHPSAQYAGTIFEGAVIGGPSGTVCNPFQFRRPMFEPHEAFQRSQELTLMHASMLQQQQLYQLQQQALVSRWRIFVCKECGESLTHYRSVKAHLLSHGSRPLSCRFCRQRQVNEIALHHHLCGGQHWKQSVNVSREMFMCRVCGKFLTSKKKLKIHMETDHQVDLPKDIKCTCRFCGLQLGQRSSMFCHYRQHAAGRLVCRKCGAILNDFVQYATHMAWHEKRRKKLTCQHCGQVFRSSLKLSDHLATHTSYACARCQRTFSSQALLSRHQCKAPHVKIRGKMVKARSGRGHQSNISRRQVCGPKDSEQQSHAHADEKLLDCTTCKMRFHSRRALGKHRRTLGHCQRIGKSREAQHLCSECGKSYFRRQALHRHLRQHQSSKPFNCKYCSFRCGAKDNLRRHEAQHFSTQRNFICELCGAAFHAKKTLEMHHSYKHNSERRFKCSECPMTFKARNALNRHAKTHSRSREHGCWCGAAFNRLYNLRRHMRLVHGSDEALPPLRKVEVLDLNQSVKQALSTPPAKKMLVKSRKVKADCMQKEQEAAAAAVVVGGEEDVGGGEGGEGDPSGRRGRGRRGEPSSLPFPHLSHHPSLDYSQLPNLSTVVPYPSTTNIAAAATAAATTTTTATNPPATTTTSTNASRQDYYPGSSGGGGGGGMEGGPQQSAAEYTTSPFSFIQNFLLPSVGVANLLDLAHASGAK